MSGQSHVTCAAVAASVTRRCRCRADAYAHTPKVELLSGRLCASYKEWVG